MVTPAEIIARRSLIIWLLISLFSISAEIVALVMVSLSTEQIDLAPLIEQRDFLQAHAACTEKQNTHTAIHRVSVRALLEHISTALSPDARLVRAQVTCDGATLNIEAKTSSALDTTLQALLANHALHEIALIDRHSNNSLIAATLAIASWES